MFKTSGVAPLGPADSNATGVFGGIAKKADLIPAKAVKRPAAGAGAGEKRKKALKRL